MKRNIVPLGNNILVKLIKEPTETSGGVMLPENAKESPSEATVLELGKGKFISVSESGVNRFQPVNVVRGDKVLFKKWGGNEVKSDDPDEELRLIDQDDILAIIR